MTDMSGEGMDMLPDPIDVAREAMHIAMEDTVLPDSVDVDQLIEDALEPANMIFDGATMLDEETGKEIELLIAGVTSSVQHWSDEVTHQEAHDTVADELVDDLEAAGLPAEDNADAIAEIIEDVSV